MVPHDVARKDIDDKRTLVAGHHRTGCASSLDFLHLQFSGRSELNCIRLHMSSTMLCVSALANCIYVVSQSLVLIRLCTPAVYLGMFGVRAVLCQRCFVFELNDHHPRTAFVVLSAIFHTSVFLFQSQKIYACSFLEAIYKATMTNPLHATDCVPDQGLPINSYN